MTNRVCLGMLVLAAACSSARSIEPPTPPSVQPRETGPVECLRETSPPAVAAGLAQELLAVKSRVKSLHQLDASALPANDAWLVKYGWVTVPNEDYASELEVYEAEVERRRKEKEEGRVRLRPQISPPRQTEQELGPHGLTLSVSFDIVDPRTPPPPPSSGEGEPQVRQAAVDYDQPDEYVAVPGSEAIALHRTRRGGGYDVAQIGDTFVSFAARGEGVRDAVEQGLFALAARVSACSE